MLGGKLSKLRVLFLNSLCLWLLASSVEAGCATFDVQPRYLTHNMDGDTLSVFSIPQGSLKFRVQGVDTPERKDPRWGAARDFTWAWLNRGPFTIETCWKHTLDRYEGTVRRGPETLASAIKAAGLEK